MTGAQRDLLRQWARVVKPYAITALAVAAFAGLTALVYEYVTRPGPQVTHGFLGTHWTEPPHATDYFRAWLDAAMTVIAIGLAVVLVGTAGWCALAYLRAAFNAVRKLHRQWTEAGKVAD
jgi:hypothetical protein